MIEQQLSALESGALARILSARSPEELEPVRIEVLGRKGSLAQISKDMGKIAPEERARIGKLLTRDLAQPGRANPQTKAPRHDGDTEWAFSRRTDPLPQSRQSTT